MKHSEQVLSSEVDLSYHAVLGCPEGSNAGNIDLEISKLTGQACLGGLPLFAGGSMGTAMSLPRAADEGQGDEKGEAPHRGSW